MQQAGYATSVPGLLLITPAGIFFPETAYPRFREDTNSSILAFTCLYFWSCTK